MRRYSLNRYNLPDNQDIRRSFKAVSELKMVSIHGGKDIPTTFLPNDGLQLNITAGVAIRKSFNANSELSFECKFIPAIGGKLVAKTSLNLDTNIIKEMSRKLSGFENLKISVIPSKDISLILGAKDDLQIYAFISKDIKRAIFANGEMFVFGEAAFLDIESIFINASIPPNGILRIDTENYTVTLNNKNIIHLQEGDWIKLMRGLDDVSVSSGTGGKLEGNVVYTEAYL